MRLDKAVYLGLACFTGFIAILGIILGNYGSNVSKEPNFLMFFKWYIFLFVFNILNIMVTLIFHYIMADIPGVKGLKGFQGDKGMSGENTKCFCGDQVREARRTLLETIDINRDVKTRDVFEIKTSQDDQRVGTVIYHDNDDNNNTPLSLGEEHKYTPS